jgi:hypothetical protein
LAIEILLVVIKLLAGHAVPPQWPQCELSQNALNRNIFGRMHF